MTYRINWAAGTISSLAAAYGVIYGDKFVAVANGGGGGSAYTSTDGITWTQHSSLPSIAPNPWISVAYNGSVYAAVSQNSTDAAHSTDGITWTTTTNLPSADSWMKVVYGAGVFVTVSSSSSAGAYSSDGISWTPQTMPYSSYGYGLTFGCSKFLSPYYVSSANYSYSSNGTTWSTGTMPVADTWTFVGSPSLTIALGTTNSVLYYSTDGTTWTLGTYPSLTVNASCYGNGVFLAVSDNQYQVSATGTGWSGGTINLSNQGFVIAAGPSNEFVALMGDGPNGAVYAAQYGYLSLTNQIVMVI